jgi:O-antigen/teichoic acid export membrane protein
MSTLIDRLSELLGTNLRYIVKGGFWLTLGEIVSTATTFLSALVFANLLPRETYGTYSFVLSISGILAIPTLSGIGTAITRAVARGYEGSIIPALKTKIRWGLLASLSGLILAAYYYVSGNSVLAIAFLIAAAFLPFLDTFGMYDSLLYGRKLFDVSSLYFILIQIITATALIGTIFITKNVFFILLAYFASWTFSKFIIFQLVLKKFPPNKEVDPKAINYGKHLSVISIIGTIANYLDSFLIFHYLGAAELAVYSLAVGPPEQIKNLLSSLTTLTFPKFAERTVTEIKKAMARKFFQLFLLACFVIGSYILIAPYFYQIFFPKYLDSVFYSKIFALSMFNMVFFPAGTFLQAKRKIKEQYWTNLLTSVFQIVIMTVFILWQGLLGLVVARILSRSFGSAINLFFYWRASADTTTNKL